MVAGVVIGKHRTMHRGICDICTFGERNPAKAWAGNEIHGFHGFNVTQENWQKGMPKSFTNNSKVGQQRAEVKLFASFFDFAVGQKIVGF